MYHLTRMICLVVVVCLLCSRVDSLGFSPSVQKSEMTGGSGYSQRAILDNSTTSGGGTSGQTTSTSTTTTGGDSCCASCSQYATCQKSDCTCECFAGFSGTGAYCYPLADPVVQTAQWDILTGDFDSWVYTGDNVDHTAVQYSVLVWTNMLVASYGTAYCFKASITSAGSTWGFVFSSVDNYNYYVVTASRSNLQFSVKYKNVVHDLASTSIEWKVLDQHELKICVENNYYSIFIDDVIYPSNTTYYSNILGSGLGGVVGLMTDGQTQFDDVMFTSSEKFELKFLECTSSDTVSSVFGSILSLSSFEVQPFSEQNCKKRADSVIGVTLYGNASVSAKALFSILQPNLESSNNIFTYAGLTIVSVQLTNTTTQRQNNVVALSLPADQTDQTAPESNELTSAQIGGIVGGGIGFIVVIVVGIILASERRKKKTKPKRKHAETMNIPKYPTVPIDGTLRNMKKNKKQKHRSTLLDMFGHPKKSNSKSSIMMNMAGDV